MNSQEWHARLRQGQQLQQQGDHAGAEAVFRDLAGQPDNSPGQSVLALDLLARCLHDRHEDAEAVRLLEGAVTLARTALCWQDPLKAGVMQNLARLHLLGGRREASVALGTEVLEGMEKALGSGHVETARAMQNLAAAHYELKHWDRAEYLLLRAKSVWEAQAAPLPELAVCYNNLGRINEERGQYARGIAWHRQAVALRRRLLGEHPDTAFSLGNLGVALASAGEWEEAARTLEECLACYARCGQTGGSAVEGYRRNLEVCRQAMAAGGRAAGRTSLITGSLNDSNVIDLDALRALSGLLPYADDEETSVVAAPAAAAGVPTPSTPAAPAPETASAMPAAETVAVLPTPAAFAPVAAAPEVPAPAGEAERQSLLRDIVEQEWRMFQATPNEGDPAVCQKNPHAFRLMRHMSHIVHDVPFLRSYAEDLRAGERNGRNFMIEKYARMADKLPPLQTSPLLDEITEQESLFLREAAWKHPRIFRAAQGQEFCTYLRCELESLSLRSLELYAAEIRQARQQGINFAQVRYEFLKQHLGGERA